MEIFTMIPTVIYFVCYWKEVTQPSSWSNLSGFTMGISFLFFSSLNLSKEKRLNTLPSAQAEDKKEREVSSRTPGSCMFYNPSW